MKIKDSNTTEPYTKIASRAKLCLEAEQRRCIGGWVDRVLVIDKATLYTYRTRGNNGSLGAWVIGNSEVYVRKPRKDGRYTVAILRQDAYNLIFALNSLDEQAAFIQALSSSGATIVGIYGIILLGEYKAMQTAIKMSLGEQHNCTDQNAVLLNSKNRTSHRPVLEMPQLSSRMTAMTWTFSNPVSESYPDVVPKNMSAKDINQSHEESEDQGKSSKILLEDETRHEKGSDIPGDDNERPVRSTAHDMDHNNDVCNETKSAKKPLKRTNHKDKSENKTDERDEIAKNDQTMAESEKSLPFLQKTGKVSKMRHLFEGIKNESSTNKTTKARVQRRQGQNLDEQKMRLSVIANGNHSVVILSGLIGTAQSPTWEFVLNRVELKQGQLLLLPPDLQQQEKTTDIPFASSKSSTSQPAIRINLQEVSTIPFFENDFSNLILKRKNKRILVLQFGSKEELTIWAHALSDEIMSSTPLTKRNSLTLYSTSSSLKETSPSELSTKKERKSSSAKKAGTSFFSGNEFQKVNDTSGDKPLSNPYLSVDSKNLKEAEKNSESLFRGLRKKLAIRRSSKEMDNVLVALEVEECLNTVQETSEKSHLMDEHAESDQLPDVLSTEAPGQKDDSEQVIPLTSKGTVYSIFSGNVCQDLFEETNKISGIALNVSLNDERDFSNTKETRSRFSDGTKSFIEENRNSKRGEYQNNGNYAFAEHNSSQSSRDQSLKSKRFSWVRDMITNFNILSIVTDSSPKLEATLENVTNKKKDQVKKKIFEINMEPVVDSSISSSDKMEETQKRIKEKAEKTSTSLNEKSLYSWGIENPLEAVQTKVYKIEGMKEGYNKTDVNKESTNRDNTNESNYEENGSVKVTWSVAALKERYEILSTVAGKIDHCCRHSWNRNSINKRKETRNSIRRKKTFEGESRRASIRRGTQKKSTVIKEPHDKNVESQIPLIRISNVEESNQIPAINNSNANDKLDRKSYFTLDSKCFGRSHSFNSRRSIIVSRNRGLKSLKGRSSLRYDRKLVKDGMKKTNFIQSESSNNAFQTNPRLLIKGENEASIYENLNNTFLAKRCLIAKELEVARIQDATVHQEEEVCRIQLKINSLSAPKNLQFERKSGERDEEVQVLEKLEQELIIAKTQYDILEDRLNEAKHKTNIARQQMEINVRRCLEE